MTTLKKRRLTPMDLPLDVEQAAAEEAPAPAEGPSTRLFSAVLQVRVTPQQRARWALRARACDMSLGTWIRAVLDGVVKAR